MIALLAEGHILVEDYPGVGKTALARALSRTIDCQFARVQCTADLLPADIVGTNVYNQREARFEFRPGPIFANVVLVDEVNRASPKTQSGLLECMQERHVTVDVYSHELARPFLVFATQNPVEYEGTYPLPEAQVDRFMVRLSLGYPSPDDEAGMLAGHESGDRVLELEPVVDVAEVLAAQDAARRVHASEALRDYIVSLLRRTRDDERVELGASPRAGLMLLRAAKASRAHPGPRPRAARRRAGARPRRPRPSHHARARGGRPRPGGDRGRRDRRHAGAVRSRPCARPSAAPPSASCCCSWRGRSTPSRCTSPAPRSCCWAPARAPGSGSAAGARRSSGTCRAAACSRRSRSRCCVEVEGRAPARSRRAGSTSRCCPSPCGCGPAARRARVRVEVTFGRRGRRTLAPPVLVLRDPFGLAERVVPRVRGARGARAAADRGGAGAVGRRRGRRRPRARRAHRRRRDGDRRPARARRGVARLPHPLAERGARRAG